MLVLKRKAGESIIVNENIEIKIIEIEEGRIKIGIEAPKDVSILRKEVLDEAHMENKQASENKNIDKSALSSLIKK
ncbi:MAG: carbon storage regulator [Peptostreptococcaceae bacterium]|jgi:carbon storage regulator|nr:carbon storage regulator [Peptostreptococcaceae bacterium]